MGKINAGRLIAGGIVAGILVNISESILNAVVLRNQWAAIMHALGKPMTAMGSRAMVVWIACCFARGLLCVWLYCGIRPRFGPGAATAAKAGFVAWLLAGLLASAGMWNLGIVTLKVLVVASIWTLGEFVLVTIVGASVYREA